MAEARNHSIGEVLSMLKDEHTDVTISKIRFFESQGLIAPERTPSGYRKFYDGDIDRLRWILVQQRDHFLPLKVIKRRMEEPGFDPTVEVVAVDGPLREPTLFSRPGDGPPDDAATSPAEEVDVRDDKPNEDNKSNEDEPAAAPPEAGAEVAPEAQVEPQAEAEPEVETAPEPEPDPGPVASAAGTAGAPLELP